MLRDLEAFLRYVTLIAVRFYLLSYLPYLVYQRYSDKRYSVRQTGLEYVW